MIPYPVTTPGSVKDFHDINKFMEIQTGGCEKLVELGGNWYCQGFDGNKDVSRMRVELHIL